MRKIAILFALNIILGSSIYSQKINADSLLVKTNYQINVAKNYPKGIELAQLGIKTAPTYLDFHEALGKAYKQSGQADNAREQLNYVIDRNPKYKDSFIYLIELETAQKNIPGANAALDKAMLQYPDDKDFQLLKLRVLALEKDDAKSATYLNELVKQYPSDPDLKKQLDELNSTSVSDRIGVNYNFTTFSRDEVGPWQLVGLQYIRERRKLTLIGRVNYADRKSLGESVASGILH